MRKRAGVLPVLTLIDVRMIHVFVMANDIPSINVQDSDTDESDVEATATHDKVSIDEQLFEYPDKVCSLLSVAVI